MRLRLVSDRFPDSHVAPQDDWNPKPVCQDDQEHESRRNISCEIAVGDCRRRDGFLDPVIFEQRNFAPNITARLPEQTSEHEYETLPEAYHGRVVRCKPAECRCSRGRIENAR